MAGQALTPARFQEILQRHEDQLQAHEDQIQALTAVRKTIRPKPCLPDPDKLASQAQYDTWLPEVKAKLEVDADAIGGPKAQFWYLYGRLDAKTKALVLAQVHGGADQHPAAIFDQLDRVFESPNKVRRAQDRLAELKMGTDSFSFYLAKFERALHEGKASEWPDEIKISHLRRGIAEWMKRRLDVQLALPTEYSAFVSTLHQLAGMTNNYGGAGRSGNDHGQKNGDLMDISAVNRLAARELWEASSEDEG